MYCLEQKILAGSNSIRLIQLFKRKAPNRKTFNPQLHASVILKRNGISGTPITLNRVEVKENVLNMIVSKQYLLSPFSIQCV